MIDLECPNCGRRGSVPENKVSTRLVCKKCHIVFHMTPTGRPMIGEPPAPVTEKPRKTVDDPTRAAVQELKETEWIENLFVLNRRKVFYLVTVVAILGAGLLAKLSTGGNDNLTRKAEKMASALLAKDPTGLKGLATGEGAPTLKTWFDALTEQLETLNPASAKRDLRARVLVLDENHAKQHGEVLILLVPETGAKGEYSVVDRAGSSAEAGETVLGQFTTYWILDNGLWKIDATRTASNSSLKR